MLFARIFCRFLTDKAVHFGLAYGDAVALANLAEQQTKAHTALGDPAIIATLGFDLGARGGRIGILTGFLFELTPDLFELAIDHRNRHIEIMARGQRIEQLALHVSAGQSGQFGIELVLEDVFQRVDRIDAEHLGEFIIEFGFSRGFDTLHKAGEFCRLTL